VPLAPLTRTDVLASVCVGGIAGHAGQVRDGGRGQVVLRRPRRSLEEIMMVVAGGGRGREPPLASAAAGVAEQGGAGRGKSGRSWRPRAPGGASRFCGANELHCQSRECFPRYSGSTLAGTGPDFACTTMVRFTVIASAQASSSPLVPPNEKTSSLAQLRLAATVERAVRLSDGVSTSDGRPPCGIRRTRPSSHGTPP
jgi:hypothetical protein